MKKSFLILCAVLGAFTVQAQCSGSSHHAKQTNYHHASNTIVDVASSADDFSTLVAAVKAADLAGTLQGDGPFTVFAPLNSAFAKLPNGTLKTLLQPENKGQLATILTYHVVSGEFNAKDIIAAIKGGDGSFTVETVSGDKLVASLSNGNVILTDENGGVSAVTKTDVGASNGVIHVIDTVVLPG